MGMSAASHHNVISFGQHTRLLCYHYVWCYHRYHHYHDHSQQMLLLLVVGVCAWPRAQECGSV